MKKIKCFFHVLLMFQFVVGNTHAMRPGIQNEDTEALVGFMRATPDKKSRFLGGVLKRQPEHLRHSTGGRLFISPPENHLLINYQAALNLFLEDWENDTLSSSIRTHAALGRAKLLVQRGIYSAGLSKEAYRGEILDNLNVVKGFADIPPHHHFHALLWEAVTFMDGYEKHIWSPGETLPLAHAWDCLNAAEELKTKHNLSKTVYLWKGLIIAEKGFRPLDDVPPDVSSEEYHKSKALEWLALYKGITSKAPSSHSVLFSPSHAATAQAAPAQASRGIPTHTDYKDQGETQALESRLQSALSNWHVGASEEDATPGSEEREDDESHGPGSGTGPQGPSPSHSQDPDSNPKDSDSEDDDGGPAGGNTAHSEGMESRSLGFNLLSSEPMEEDSRETSENPMPSYDDRAMGQGGSEEIFMETEASSPAEYRSEELPTSNASKRKTLNLESGEERESEEEDQHASPQKAKKARSFENPLYEKISAFLEEHQRRNPDLLMMIDESYTLLGVNNIVTESELQPRAVKTFIRKKLIKLGILINKLAPNSKYEEIETRLEEYSQSGLGKLTMSEAMALLVDEGIIQEAQTKDKNYTNNVRRKLNKFKILKETEKALYSREIEVFFTSHKDAEGPNLKIDDALKTLRAHDIIPKKSDPKESARVKALVRLILDKLEIFAETPPRQPAYDPLKKALGDYAAQKKPPLSVAEAFDYLVEVGELEASQKKDAGIVALLKRELYALKIHKTVRENGPYYEILENFFLGYKGEKLTVSEAWPLLIKNKIVPQEAKDKHTLTNSSLKKALERHKFFKSSRESLDME